MRIRILSFEGQIVEKYGAVSYTRLQIKLVMVSLQTAKKKKIHIRSKNNLRSCQGKTKQPQHHRPTAWMGFLGHLSKEK